MFFRMHGQKVLVLNNYKAASDLLDGRSATYSDRPMAWMYKELVGRKLAVFNISSKHPRFRRYRALLQGGLNPRAARGYRAVQEEQARAPRSGSCRMSGGAWSTRVGGCEVRWSLRVW